jgi:hypothetical protein
MNKSILIIGKPNSSKTTFIAQLYSRLIDKNFKLTLYKPVEDFTLIKEALELLAQGKETEPTSAEINQILSLPIQIDGKKIDIVCPDYGGEQINEIINQREINETWKRLIKESNNWVLFIRLNSLTTNYDLSNKTISPDLIENKNNSLEEYSISDQSSFIELLQIMLHIKKQDLHFKSSNTILTIALTCWDELETVETPTEKLNSDLPLLHNFIQSNWENNQFNIVGLSAQGFSLNNIENQKKYQIKGPENFGFLIKKDGTRTNDITILVSESL